MPSLPAIRTESFSLVFSDTGSTPALRLSGNGDGEVVTPLDRTLKQLHEELSFSGARSVVVDLSDLYFMNSSCLKAFVSWIYKVRTSGKPYQIRMQLNPRQRWQQRGLEPLQRLAPAIVFLDVIPEVKAADGVRASRAPGGPGPASGGNQHG
jgi:anti-anti-sigma regulatory factor